MDILYLMIVCSVSLAAIFLVVFIVYAKKGQFEDDESPAVRILFDDEVKEKKENGDKDKDDKEIGENNKN
ncbi:MULTISPECIES: cbb3-type cytochrome oxidase assembly protein CcoS [Chryseobacterium]|jgi:cbb3-type cytochrome oxidase maturation protein|uniref:Cytochrome oxidase maturation protein, cbb3-type n=1 Tax=Chryseobacterium contaminans TaxID=1423959 RepID=A0A1M7HHU8_9FLAO|nr:MULTISPECIES: cbb3-type cytochrome oxidase assembly protein CcoS [Chryseobacterium]MDM1556540.1 cbb3-type cytochrome oxidase assembly protein CcoS [Chryseobacterium indologenes]OCA78518.1 cytochrome oxidase maturation protein, cbb3-type [Chryseobacterium contaminans]RXM50911.1 cbb3-type cytochrome oxidase assembly protein CcoS [Chryseobacterium sp. CH25]RXM62076.1 cbb3-type cytochrome oxidase assembly protein CcoS [Chryseobacterium sp. CH1]WET47792.1 cbb3-type cytochrome oxidase assembly pr